MKQYLGISFQGENLLKGKGTSKVCQVVAKWKNKCEREYVEQDFLFFLFRKKRNFSIIS